MSGFNKACCTRTPVGTSQSVPVSKIADLDVYVAGNTSAKRGVILVYDIFGLYPQTLKGADRLSEHLDAVTLVPEFLRGAQADPSWFPMDNQEKKEAFGKFFTDHASLEKNTEKLLEVVAEAKTKYPSVEKWAVVGLCWGGKLAALVSGENTPFAASGQAHPSFLAPDDVKNMTIPHIVLASGEESKEEIAAYKEALEAKKDIPSEVDLYDTQVHGWMGARADFNDEENKKEFERGYKQVADFFGKFL
ncbi:hypothetical protein Plec18170_003496 [Paecilomyces lecythidis]